jgi:Trk-type K+ transport system membrane component
MKHIGWLLVVCGMVGLVGAKAYHFFIRPEWTEPIAFRELWYVWLGSVVIAVAGARMLDRQRRIDILD